jgi:hypothetical protein
MHMEEWRYTSTYSQTEVNCELHETVPLRPGEELSVPVESDAVWAADLFWTLWKENYFLPLSGIEPRYLGCRVRSLATISVNVTQKQCKHTSEESYSSVSTPHFNCFNHVSF